VGAALLVMAAAARVAGFGAPSEEECQRDLAIPIALDRPIYSAYQEFRQWDADDLVLPALACVAAAPARLDPADHRSRE
jgi:hypothetical protein